MDVLMLVCVCVNNRKDNQILGNVRGKYASLTIVTIHVCTHLPLPLEEDSEDEEEEEEEGVCVYVCALQYTPLFSVYCR